MKVTNKLLVGLLIGWVRVAVASVRRPECGFDSNRIENDYFLYRKGSSDITNESGHDEDLRIVDMERGEIDLEAVLKGLPNETFLSVVSAFEQWMTIKSVLTN